VTGCQPWPTLGGEIARFFWKPGFRRNPFPPRRVLRTAVGGSNCHHERGTRSVDLIEKSAISCKM
jgi:hypothetical protein